MKSQKLPRIWIDFARKVAGILRQSIISSFFQGNLLVKSVTGIRIFACFPSDVAEEARQLDAIADKLNRSFAIDQGYRFEVLRWDRDVASGVGNDVQDVVN